MKEKIEMKIMKTRFALGFWRHFNYEMFHRSLWHNKMKHVMIVFGFSLLYLMRVDSRQGDDEQLWNLRLGDKEKSDESFN